MIEFKVDQRDGVAKLMDIWPRFWGSLQLAIDAGVDFPAILVENGEGQSATTLACGAAGSGGDVDALLLRFFDRNEKLPTGTRAGCALRSSSLGSSSPASGLTIPGPTTCGHGSPRAHSGCSEWCRGKVGVSPA